MTSGSLFSGIGGFDLGFREAGIKTLWMAEKEPFCQAVLRTQFPDAELFGDVSYVTSKSARAVDVLSAGFPCQDLSVAGKRAGLGGSRSGLFWEIVRVLRDFRDSGKPIRWFVLENVPGLFSSFSDDEENGVAPVGLHGEWDALSQTDDFETVLSALDELGYGLAWRVLNSQFFGVAQRRRRVFVVGCFGKPCPREVLFESESGGGNIETSGEARPDIAVPLTSGLGVTGNSAGRRCEDDFNLAIGSLQSHSREHGHAMSTQQAAECGQIVVSRALANSGSGYRFDPNGEEYIVCGTIEGRRGTGPQQAATGQLVASLSGIGSGGPDDNDGQSNRIVCGCWDKDAWHKKYGLQPGERCANAVSAPPDSNRVRNFTSLPQGLDSARYRALGNAVTSYVSRWIGRRIVEASR